jgi:DNA-binding CsgD family transcriptional regulator
MQVGIDAGALVEVAAQARELRAYELGVLDVLRRGVGFDVAMFKRPDGVGEHGLDAKIAHACRAHWGQFKLDATPVIAAALGRRGVAVDVDVLGMRRLERLSYYQRLMRPHRGKSTAIVCLMRHGSVASTLALGRTGGGFAEAELDYLRALGPALSVCESAALSPRPALPLGVSLTAREREVLSHLRLGHTNAQIALALGTAERTVRNQLSAVYEKLGVGSRAEAAALSVELEWRTY